MKTKFIKNRLIEMNKDSGWLAGQCGVEKITMDKNYMRGLCPGKPILMLMAQALKCKIKDLVYEDELGDRSA